MGRFHAGSAFSHVAAFAAHLGKEEKRKENRERKTEKGKQRKENRERKTEKGKQRKENRERKTEKGRTIAARPGCGSMLRTEVLAQRLRRPPLPFRPGSQASLASD